MAWPGEWWRRLRFVMRREARSRELDEEMRFHVDMKATGYAGLSRDDAVRAARRQFGNVTSLTERSRDAWGWVALDQLAQDLRDAVRQIWRRPGLTLVITASLALGIGANAAVFSVVNAVMLKRLPIAEADRVVLLDWSTSQRRDGISTSGYGISKGQGRSAYLSFPYAFHEQLSGDRRAFAGVAGFAPMGFGPANLDVGIGDRRSNASGEVVTPDYFTVLGVMPVIGRTLSKADVSGETPLGVVISHDYWRREFGRDPAAAGKTLTVNGVPLTIVGVAPPGFSGLEPGRHPDLWLPVTQHPALMPWGVGGTSVPSVRAPGWWWMHMVGRLTDGVPLERARVQTEAALEAFAAEYFPAARHGASPIRLELEPAAKGIPMLRHRFVEPLTMLMSGTGLVLLIACANVATLLVARATTRRREMAVRLSLGAPRGRIIRQVLTENVLLASTGGAAGFLLAFPGAHVLLALVSSGRQVVEVDVTPDPIVLAFTGAVSLSTGLLFGLVPALRASRAPVACALQTTARTIVGGRPTKRGPGLTRTLVVAQVALSAVLLCGAGLFIRTLGNLQHQDIGFDRENLIVFGVNSARTGYEGRALASLYAHVRQAIAAVPGIRSATWSGTALLSGWRNQSHVAVEGETVERSAESSLGKFNHVGPAFFDTIGLRILMGRAIDEKDVAGQVKVAVASEAAARYFFGNTNPIGRRIRLGPNVNSEPYEIVGVAQNAPYDTVREPAARTFYTAASQDGVSTRLSFTVRTHNTPERLFADVSAAVHGVNADLTIVDMKTQATQIEQLLGDERLFAQLSSVFGVLALTLACIGLYGTMSFMLARRTNEIGIRVTLGARRGQILWMVVRDGLLMSVAGLMLGIPVAVSALRLVRSWLYGLEPGDPATIGAAMFVILITAAMAGYLPARRALRIDPVAALRHE